MAQTYLSGDVALIVTYLLLSEDYHLNCPTPLVSSAAR